MKRKIIGIILICVTLIIAIVNVNYAADTDNVLIDPDQYKPNSQTIVTGADSLFDVGNMIIGVVRIVGSVLSVIVLAVIGIKYMLGSVEERADYKTSMGPYIWGAVLVFGITNILAIIMDVISSFNK